MALVTTPEAVVLEVDSLGLEFRTPGRRSTVLHGIALHVRRGEKVALVGESGSGKSVTARLVMGLMQLTPAARVTGRIAFNGRDVTHGGRIMAGARGREVTMIFQDPTSALNPMFRVRDLFREVLRSGDRTLSNGEVDRRAMAALAEVAIPDPLRALDSYAFQLSGGMNQRVMIAMALVNRPKLLIADEPGTALDVTVQAQTLGLMQERTRDLGTAVLFISHNLGVVREFADRVYVIYRGRIVEQGLTTQIFNDPRHPYTRRLIAAVPKIAGTAVEDVPDESEDFSAPGVVHPGSEEPGQAVRVA